MLITLTADANISEIRARLQGLGLWTQTFHGEHSGRPALVVEGFSKKISPESLREIAGVADVFVLDSQHPRVDEKAGRPAIVATARTTATTVDFSGDRPILMAGPCSVESEEQIFAAAEIVARAGGRMLRGGAFKPRTSPYSFHGRGEPALGWLRDAADAHGLGVVTEVMSEANVEAVAQRADLLQIGSRNMQNFALLRAVGKAGKPVLLKRGMAATLDDWLMAAEHCLAAGASAVVFCERGIRGFDTPTRNLLDLATVALLRHVYRQPVVVDPSHAVGRRDLILPLSRAAIAAGANGLLIEMHPTSTHAQSDGAQAISPAELDALANELAFTAPTVHAPQP